MYSDAVYLSSSTFISDSLSFAVSYLVLVLVKISLYLLKAYVYLLYYTETQHRELFGYISEMDKW